MAKDQAPKLKIRVSGKTANVLLSTLINVAQQTLEILKEIDKEVTHDQRGTMDWEVVGLSLNSPAAIDVKPIRTVAQFDERSKVVNAYVSGINVLNTRRSKPRYFNERALEHTKRLAETYDDGALEIKYTVGSKTVVPQRRIIPHVDAILNPPVQDDPRTRSPRTEIGSLAGVITILKAGQHDSFVLRESLDACEVRCTFSPEFEPQVRTMWKKRVRVSGAIKYAADGTPLDINVEGIRELQSVADLPQFKDFGIDITGGMDSADYVRSLRDAN